MRRLRFGVPFHRFSDCPLNEGIDAAAVVLVGVGFDDVLVTFLDREIDSVVGFGYIAVDTRLLFLTDFIVQNDHLDKIISQLSIYVNSQNAQTIYAKFV